MICPSCLHERGERVVTDVEAGCGGRVKVLDEGLLMRTVKSCGPDTPTLVFPRNVPRRVVATWWPKSPVHQGEHEAAVKPIAQGMPDVRLDLW